MATAIATAVVPPAAAARTSLGGAYEPNDYTTLSSVDDAGARFDTLKPAFLKEFEALLNTHGMTEHVALQLIHKHFEMKDTEIMVERTTATASGPVVVSSPECAAAHGTEVVAHIWKAEKRADADGGGVKWKSLEFTHIGKPSDAKEHPAVAAVKAIEAKPEFLSALGQLICDFGLCDTVGLGLVVGGQIECKAGEALLETIDHANRRLVVAPRDAATVAAMDITETSWDYSGAPTPSAAATAAVMGGGQPSTRGCLKLKYCQKIGKGHLQAELHQRV